MGSTATGQDLKDKVVESVEESIEEESVEEESEAEDEKSSTEDPGTEEIKSDALGAYNAVHNEESTSTELVVLDENRPHEAQLDNLENNDDEEKFDMNGILPDQGTCFDLAAQVCDGLPPWLFSYQACYVAGCVGWSIIAVTTLIIAANKVVYDDDHDDDSVNSTTTCDADVLDGLAAYFLDKHCVAELSCKSQHQVTNFMDEFLDPLRVEATFLTNCFQIFNLMVLQQGGIPATRKDDENKSWWYLGCFAWHIWVSCGECITSKLSYSCCTHAPSSHAFIAIYSSTPSLTYKPTH